MTVTEGIFPKIRPALQPSVENSYKEIYTNVRDYLVADTELITNV
jgi:hypothetical protein